MYKDSQVMVALIKFLSAKIIFLNSNVSKLNEKDRKERLPWA